MTDIEKATEKDVRKAKENSTENTDATEDAAILYGKHEALKTELLNSIHSGKEPYEILTRLAEILERESGEKGYTKYVREAILAVYGYALAEKIPIEKELREVRARLSRIEKATKDERFTEEEKIRMGFAINTHKKNIARLEAMLKELEHNTSLP